MWRFDSIHESDLTIHESNHDSSVTKQLANNVTFNKNVKKHANRKSLTINYFIYNIGMFTGVEE